MYIDPGMGSLCFQALAAFLIGIGVFFGKAKLVLFWKKKKDSPDKTDESDNNGKKNESDNHC